MSIVAFKLTGDYAHFSHPATIYSSLTYPIPPKTAVMGLLGAIIGEDEYHKLNKIKYSVKVDNPISKKSFVFNGIKNALSSNMHIKEGVQNSSEKKQFYRELICSPNYTIYLDLELLSKEYQQRITQNLENHKCSYTPYLGINFCIADFEWIKIKNIEKITSLECEINSFTLQNDFIFDSQNFDIKLTTARMACDCENGRFFKNFQDFIVEMNGKNLIKSKNNGNVYKINGDIVYFV